MTEESLVAIIKKATDIVEVKIWKTEDIISEV